MTREAFLQLAGQLYDAQNGGGGSGDGRPPKFDTAIHRQGGKVQWASECSLKELTFWKTRADKPPSDPKYAERNAKQSKSLSYWIAYRQSNPNDQWRGERNKETVTAAAPSDRPEQYDKEATQAPAGYTSHPVDDNGNAPPDDFGDVPF